MKPLLAIFLLFGASFGLKENETLGGMESDVIKWPKTFRGRSKDYEKLPHHFINGSPDASTAIKQEHLDSHKYTEVNNSAMVYLRSKVSMGLIPAIYTIVVLIGVPSNIAVLWMLFHKVRSVCTAVFYTSLATSDLLFCLTLPFKIAYHINGNNWIFGEMMCRVSTVFLYGNMYCSILLLTCISISRYTAIVHPFIYRSLPKRTYAILLCVLVWIIVFMFMIPFFVTRQTHSVKQLNIVTCHDVYDISGDAFQFYYFMSLAILGFLIPIFVVAFCYICIIRALASNDKKRFWYVKISILYFIIFAVCFTPSNLILLIHQVSYLYSKEDHLYGTYLIALCLSSLNSCLDPFLYFLLSKKFYPVQNYMTILKVDKEKQATLISS